MLSCCQIRCKGKVSLFEEPNRACHLLPVFVILNSNYASCHSMEDTDVKQYYDVLVRM